MVGANADQALAQTEGLADVSDWFFGAAASEWATGNYGSALLTGAEGLAVGLAAILSNPAIDAGGIGMPLSPALAADRIALHELTKEAMGSPVLR